MQSHRHLTRHPAKSFLSAPRSHTAHKSVELNSRSLNNPELEKCLCLPTAQQHRDSSKCDQTTTYPTVIRKNSSGCCSCTSELSSCPSPTSSKPRSPLCASTTEWQLLSFEDGFYHFYLFFVSGVFFLCSTLFTCKSQAQSPILLDSAIYIYILLLNRIKKIIVKQPLHCGTCIQALCNSKRAPTEWALCKLAVCVLYSRMESGHDTS